MNSNVNSFIETGLWSTLDHDSEEHLDALYSVDDVGEDFKARAGEFIDLFMERARHLFTESELINAPIGHDLWLTCEGHGAGFWDGDYEKGEKITAVVKELCPYDAHWSGLLNDSIDKGDNQ